ncbi:AfsR/SARP family transcriptional regulator (plasmid) [Streptomyces sp. AHU1]|uniref:AfsR/SARP family transcriptional regulator n=1 Tax=Streptomyces sp. AHU1 TaxID=3377215 RepID=UPI00387809D6
MDLGSPQQQSLFVALLMREGRTATAGALIEGLWGEDEPASARRTLRTYAWRLRKVLEDNTKSPNVLVSIGDGYHLALDGDYVDFQNVEELARSAQRARQADDLEDAYDLLEAALSLWRGEPLAAIPGPFADRQRDRLNEVRLSLQEERMEVGLALGRGIRYLSELPGLIHRYPLRERLYTLLMHAQYQSGRRADALDTYRQARGVLINELGMEPGPELHALHQRVLAGAQELLATPPASRPKAALAEPPLPVAVDAAVVPASEELPAQPPARGDHPHPYPHPAQLPPDLVDFTGRGHLTLTISSLMNSPQRSALPVTVLVGMAGVGKSTLALHVAHTIRNSYPDGQLYAKLRAGDGGPVPPDDVLAGFLVSLGYRPDDLPATLEARTALFRTVLNERRVLLVLDDAVTAEQVRPLLPGSPDCGVLITARTRLGGLPALQVEVQAFYESEALDLLARTIGSRRVEAEHAAAVEIVESCAMLPLAIRIIAARLAARPSWSLRSLSARLTDEFKRIEELRSGSMTISAVFDLTYQHLPEAEASALRRTATVDSPSLSLSCAAALLDASEEDAEILLDALVDHAMLESPEPGRYRFHGLLRDFARRKTLPEERQQAMARLLDFLLATAKNAFAQVVAGDPIERALYPTRAVGLWFAGPGEARNWATEEGMCALALVRQLSRSMATGPAGHATELVHAEADTLLRSNVDLLIVLSAYRQSLNSNDFQAAVDLLEQAVANTGDLRTMGRVRFLRGNLELTMSHFVPAEQWASSAVHYCRAAEDLVILRQALNDLGLAKQMQGMFAEAIKCYDEAIELARQLGHTTGRVATTLNVALLKVQMGEASEAEKICQEVLTGMVSQEDTEGIAYTYYIMGLANHSLGRYESALRWFEECLSVCMSHGLRAREGQVRLRLAESLMAVNLLDRAVAEAKQSVELCEEVADMRTLSRALSVLGHALRDLGQEPAARENLTRADEVVASLRQPSSVRQSAPLTALPSGRETSGRP